GEEAEAQLLDEPPRASEFGAGAGARRDRAAGGAILRRHGLHLRLPDPVAARLLRQSLEPMAQALEVHRDAREPVRTGRGDEAVVDEPVELGPGVAERCEERVARR